MQQGRKGLFTTAICHLLCAAERLVNYSYPPPPTRPSINPHSLTPSPLVVMAYRSRDHVTQLSLTPFAWSWRTEGCLLKSGQGPAKVRHHTPFLPTSHTGEANAILCHSDSLRKNVVHESNNIRSTEKAV